MSHRHHNNHSKSFFNKDKSKPKPTFYPHHNQKHHKPSLSRSFTDSKQKSSSRSFNDSKQKSAFLVISDNSSDHIESNQKMQQEDVIPAPQMQIHNNAVYVDDNQAPQSSPINEKPIHARTYEQRLNLKQQPESKPAKKIKLNEDAQEQAVIIRFDAAKNSVETESIASEDVKKIQKAKLKKAYPWLSKSTKQMDDVLLRFHNQIVEFYDYIRPSRREHETRLAIFEMVKTMIVEKYPSAKVEFFGSFATKLYLPDGDIDITVLLDDIEEYQQRSVYDTINKIVRKHEGSLFCDIQYIKSSKVPLIKLVHIDTQIPFDISVNKRDGLNQVEHVIRMKKLYPEFEPMVFVLKTALKIRNMSETYTGGVGSFLLFCMILHFLRYAHKKDYYFTMGEYIMKFMEFYAISGDWERKSVYVADGTEVGRARQPNTLSFYSPQDDSHDIGKSAFKIRDVFNVFKNRFRVITGKNFKEGESILKELINPSGEEFRYYKYEKAMHKKASE